MLTCVIGRRRCAKCVRAKRCLHLDLTTLSNGEEKIPAMNKRFELPMCTLTRWLKRKIAEEGQNMGNEEVEFKGDSFE